MFYMNIFSFLLVIWHSLKFIDRKLVQQYLVNLEMSIGNFVSAKLSKSLTYDIILVHLWRILNFEPSQVIPIRMSYASFCSLMGISDSSCS
jgi:hypothetical protein